MATSVFCCFGKQMKPCENKSILWRWKKIKELYSVVIVHRSSKYFLRKLPEFLKPTHNCKIASNSLLSHLPGTTSAAQVWWDSLDIATLSKQTLKSLFPSASLFQGRRAGSAHPFEETPTSLLIPLLIAQNGVNSSLLHIYPCSSAPALLMFLSRCASAQRQLNYDSSSRMPAKAGCLAVSENIF